MRFVEHTETFFTTDSPRRRLSWLFSALVRILHSLRKPEGWRLLALHLFEVLRYVWKHFVIVLLLLLPVMLLLGMPQGKDLILNLLHTSAEGGMPGYIIRVVWFLLMLALLAYAIWAIPRFYQEKEMNDRALAASGDGMTALLRARSTSSDFLRVLAVLPLLFYGLTFIVVIRVEHVPKVPFWAFNSLLGVLILLYSIGVVYGWHRLRHIGWLMFGVMVGIPLGFSTLLSSYPQKPEFAYAILGNGLLLIACLLFILFHRWERVFELPGHASLKVFLGKWADRFYYAALVLVLGGATMLALWQNTMCMTSIPVLVFFTATYVFLIHLVLYVFMKVQAPGKLAIIAILGAIMGIFFLQPSKAHYVYLVPRDDSRPALDMDDFIDRWLDRQLEGLPDSALVIYLVSGEGGGSRAGFWTSRILTLLDEASDNEFSGKLLALSTVSGSSAGASAWLKWLKFRQEQDGTLEHDAAEAINGSLARIVFANNFVTGSIIDLLTRDFVQAANIFTGPRRHNRNLRLQEEENLGFLQALRRQPIQVRETFRPLPPREGVIEWSPWRMPNYHFLPLSSLYYDRNGEPDTRIPLAFFNTTHMQTGRRGVVAPVRLDSTRFFHAIDVLEEVERWSNAQTLSLGTANNLSELFPVFSAFAYIDSVGNFMDGGSYENKGLTTILEVREKLIEALERRKIVGARIVLLALENGTPLSDKGRLQWRQPVNQLPAMISQVATQPFEAHTAAARARAEVLLRAHPTDTVVFISLADHAPYPKVAGIPDSTRRMAFPLARDLSGVTVDSMEVAARTALTTLLPLLRAIDPGTFSGEVQVKGNTQED